MRTKILFLILIAGCTSIRSQAIDSLKKVIATPGLHDTVVAYAWFELGSELYMTQPDSAIKYWRGAVSLCTRALKNRTGKEREALLYTQGYAMGSLAYLYTNGTKTDSGIYLMEKALENFLLIDDSQGSGQVLNNLANVLMTRGEYDKAISMEQKALRYAIKARDWKAAGYIVSNMALIRSNQGNIPAALELHKLALKVREANKDYQGLGNSFFELGIIYNTMRNYDESLNYMFKSLEARRKSAEDDDIAASMDEIGNALILYKGENEKGKKYLDSARVILERTKNMARLGYLYGHLGEYYIITHQRDSAYALMSRSAAMREATGELKGYSLSLFKLGQLCYEDKDYKKALSYAQQSYQIASARNFTETLRKTSDLLRLIYSKSGDWKKAYEFLDINKMWSDSILSKENRRKTLIAGMNYEYEKKSALAKMEREKEKARLEAERDKQEARNVFALAGLGAVAVFALIMYNRFRVTRKQKRIIEIKNIETERQKEIIEQKQAEILDSIYYARRIQNALITSESNFGKMLRRVSRRKS